RLAPSHLELLVAAKRRLRRHGDFDGEGQWLTTLRQLLKVELRVADGPDSGLKKGQLEPFGKRVPNGLLEHRLAADSLNDHRARDLAFAKAGNPELPTERGGGTLEARLDLLARDLRVQPHARLRELCDLCRYGHAEV